MCAGPQLKFSFSISGRPVTYTRPLLNARFSRVFSAGCFHGHGWGQLYLSSESQSQKLPLFRPIPPTLSLPLLLSLPKSARASATGGLPGTSGPQLNQFVKGRQDSSHTTWTPQPGPESRACVARATIAHVFAVREPPRSTITYVFGRAVHEPPLLGNHRVLAAGWRAGTMSDN
jgi:hypothetical protein